MMTIKYLRHNIDKLFSAIKSSSSNPKSVSPHDEARDARRYADGHAPQHQGACDNVCAASSKRYHLTGAIAKGDGEDKSTSDDESEINFKHQRGRRSKKLRTANLEGDEIDFRNTFGNIPIPSDIPTDLTKDFKMGATFNFDDAMIKEAIEPVNVLTDRNSHRKGKEIHIERNLVERGNSASPAQTHHSVDGPSTFDINANTLVIPLDAKGIPRAPSHGMSILHYLSKLPLTRSLTEMRKLRKCTRLSRVMHGDPEPLKCKVDKYVWAVKGHLALKASLSDRHRSDQVEEERLATMEELKLAESSYDAALTKHQGLEEESVALKKKEDEPFKELEDVHQRMDQVTNDIGDNKNTWTTLETTVHATKRRMEELEAVPMCSVEEMELFEEQERKLLEFQSSLDNSEWIM
ncbi:Myosin-6 [Bienertia sinuspersici]